VLACLAQEAMILVICSSDLRQGKAVSDVDHERLVTAAERIEAGRRLACGER